MGRQDSEQRAKILDAAVETFAEQGLKAATIRMVGQRAGVNSALIYYYFENKETMFVAALSHSLEVFFDLLQSRRRPFPTARERLACLVYGLFDFYTDNSKSALLVATAVHEHPELMARTVNSLFRERTALPFAILQEGIELKQLRAENPAILWWGVLGMCMFAFKAQKVFAHLDLKGLPIQLPDWQSHREKILDMLVDGLALPAATKTQPSTRRKSA